MTRDYNANQGLDKDQLSMTPLRPKSSQPFSFRTWRLPFSFHYSYHERIFFRQAYVKVPNSIPNFVKAKYKCPVTLLTQSEPMREMRAKWE